MLKRRLETDNDLQNLLDQYVAIHFDTEDPAFAEWSRKYPPRSAMVPMLFIVSSSGQVLYNNSGAPSGPQLPGLLQRGLQENRRVAEAKSLEAAKQRRLIANAAAALVEQQKYGEAIGVLKPLLTKQTPVTPMADGDDGAMLVELHSRLQQLGHTHLDKAKRYLADEQHRLFGLLALAKTRRIFGDLPGLSAAVDGLLEQVRQDPQLASGLSQAELIDRGRAAEQAGDPEAAIEIYEQVAAAYRGSLAERLCEVRIKQLTNEKVAIHSESDSEPTATR
jgi:hypothetical protein